jgi:hypothetical protein
MTFFPMHIFSNPIQGKGKMTQGIRSFFVRNDNFELTYL